jgi:hypothetical protein
LFFAPLALDRQRAIGDRHVELALLEARQLRADDDVLLAIHDVDGGCLRQQRRQLRQARPLETQRVLPRLLHEVFEELLEVVEGHGRRARGLGRGGLGFRLAGRRLGGGLVCRCHGGLLRG